MGSSASEAASAIQSKVVDSKRVEISCGQHTASMMQPAGFQPSSQQYRAQPSQSGQQTDGQQQPSGQSHSGQQSQQSDPATTSTGPTIKITLTKFRAGEAATCRYFSALWCRPTLRSSPSPNMLFTETEANKQTRQGRDANTADGRRFAGACHWSKFLLSCDTVSEAHVLAIWK
jgi:hypothetical protein